MNKVHQIYDIYFVEDNTFVEDEERLYRAFGLADKVRRRIDGGDKGWYNDGINRGKPDKVRED